MLALRYVYLLALVIWLGGMVVLGAIVAPTTFQILQAHSPEIGTALATDTVSAILQRFQYVAYGAGAVLLITLVLMGVLGPRPAGFAVRMAVIFLMIIVAAASGVMRQDVLTLRLMGVNMLAAAALLYLEAREQVT